MQGEGCPDDDQSIQDQSADETGEEIVQIQYSAEVDHQCFENPTASLGHARIQQRTIEQVVNVHDLHNVHAVKMEQYKIIKNTVQRTNPIIQEKINQMRCKAKLTAFKPCRNRGEQHEWGHLPFRYATISANDARSTENVSGEPREDSIRCCTSMRLSRITVTVQRLMQKTRKKQKEHPDTLCISTDPVHNEKTRGIGARRA